jgi:hypothetical protein
MDYSGRIFGARLRLFTVVSLTLLEGGFAIVYSTSYNNGRRTKAIELKAIRITPL